jgi:hypothetical protein
VHARASCTQSNPFLQHSPILSHRNQKCIATWPNKSNPTEVALLYCLSSALVRDMLEENSVFFGAAVLLPSSYHRQSVVDIYGHCWTKPHLYAYVTCSFMNKKKARGSYGCLLKQLESVQIRCPYESFHTDTYTLTTALACGPTACAATARIKISELFAQANWTALSGARTLVASADTCCFCFCCPVRWLCCLLLAYLCMYRRIDDVVDPASASAASCALFVTFGKFKTVCFKNEPLKVASLQVFCD